MFSLNLISFHLFIDSHSIAPISYAYNTLYKFPCFIYKRYQDVLQNPQSDHICCVYFRTMFLHCILTMLAFDFELRCNKCMCLFSIQNQQRGKDKRCLHLYLYLYTMICVVAINFEFQLVSMILPTNSLHFLKR